jgi:hypothetical protein
MRPIRENHQHSKELLHSKATQQSKQHSSKAKQSKELLHNTAKSKAASDGATKEAGMLA